MPVAVLAVPETIMASFNAAFEGPSMLLKVTTVLCQLREFICVRLDRLLEETLGLERQCTVAA